MSESVREEVDKVRYEMSPLGYRWHAGFEDFWTGCRAGCLSDVAHCRGSPNNQERLGEPQQREQTHMGDVLSRLRVDCRGG